MKVFRTPFFLLLFCLFHHAAFSQKGNYSAYTVNDGLPSNHVYHCAEDNHGFLWVATDAGIARFDGRHFQVFTTEHGVPDNEVLQVVKENNGTIWINCFRQSPAYFDEVKNRFVNASEDSSLAKVSGTGNMYLIALTEGGVKYTNEKGSFIFRDKKLVTYPYNILKENDDGSSLRWSYKNPAAVNAISPVIYRMEKENTTDSIRMKERFLIPPHAFGIDTRIYLFNTLNGKGYVYSGISSNPIRYQTDSVVIPETYFSFGFTPDLFYMISNSARIYAFRKKDLKLEHVINGDYIPNGFYNDSRGNLWVLTVDKGLLVYRKTQYPNLELPAGFSRANFMSVIKHKDGRVLAGNYYGEVLEFNREKVTVHTVVKKTPSRQRKIIIVGNDVYTISEDGIYINFKKEVKNISGQIASGKTGVLYDDSTIIIGAMIGQLLLDIPGQKIRSYNRNKRVTAMVKGKNNTVYFGSTDGLYKYDFNNDSLTSLSERNARLNERITGLCITPDDLLWVATSGNGIFVLKAEKVIAGISQNDGLINNACRTLATGNNDHVWVGTSQGLSIINYNNMIRDSIRFTIRNLSVNDGLTNNEINDMSFYNDTMYLATAHGISVVPARISVPVFNIPVKLVRISINERDTIINTSYSLNSHQQHIQMQFAAIELDGHFKYLQYSLDNKNWIPLYSRILTLQLNTGDHSLRVRAVDVHGHVSNKILTLYFDIETPFWKTIWFWLILALLLQGLLYYLFIRWQKQRKEARLSKEIAVVQTASLEQQAFTSLMNPHFIFNALNSIQHYINLQDRQKANRYLSDFASLIRKNFEASQQSFISLEQELESIKIYLRLEQMRFADRFTYHITVDERSDTEGWMIPTMILQPLLENAILHGLMPSAIKGELHVAFTQSGNDLLITITDNGVGLQQSLASKGNNGHKSHGMELIRKRINALGKLAARPITMDMSPAFDDTLNPGNRILLKIPADLYDAWLKATKAH